MRRILFESLVNRSLTEKPPAKDEAALAELAARVDRAARRKLGRSLSIREVDAGSCNGCELEIHALNNAFYDLERFGLHFVASPRHADVLMVTGPVSKSMREALMRTYNATPDPKWVVAVGDCAVDGGIFAGSYAVAGGVQERRAGRSAHSRLSAHAGAIAGRAARAPRSCRVISLLGLCRCSRARMAAARRKVCCARSTTGTSTILPSTAIEPRPSATAFS